MNLNNRLKRHIVGPRHDFFAVTHPGLEAICRQELATISSTIAIVAEANGGVAFSGKMSDLYAANLHLRSSGRIVMRLAHFAATNFRQFEKQAGALPWELYLPWGALPAFRVSCRQSRLYHSQAVEQRIAALLSAYWQKLGVGTRGEMEQTLLVRIENDMVTLSLDSSGANLYQRGLKTHHGLAPLRETLAAGILALGGYDPKRPLIDPMCGSGTFALEAALITKQIPPGRFRSFAFMRWPAFSEPQWRYCLKTADVGAVTCPMPLILASDKNAQACRQLADCVVRNRLADAVSVQCRDFFAPPAPGQAPIPTGMIVLNPPYGRRLKPADRIEKFYQAIGHRLADAYPGWRLAMVVPQPELARLLPFATQAATLPHGGLQLTLLTGRIPVSIG